MDSKLGFLHEKFFLDESPDVFSVIILFSLAGKILDARRMPSVVKIIEVVSLCLTGLPPNLASVWLLSGRILYYNIDIIF